MPIETENPYWSDKEIFKRWLLEKKNMTIEEMNKLLPGEQMKLENEWRRTRTDLYIGSLDGM